MGNELKIEGNDNVSFQDINNSSITFIINKSNDYKKLLDDLSSLEEDLENYNPEKIDKINQLKGRIANKKQEIERFKKDVINLADAFSRINIDTLRLIKAKAYFDKGDFKEANAILKLIEIDKDQNQILTARDRKEKELKELEKQLVDNSNEYYIKAKATILESYISNKFADIFNLFKRSIKSHSGFNNNFALGDFLMNSQRYHIAEPYLITALEHKNEADSEQLSGLLNSIGVCLKEQGKYKEAEKYYIDSIKLQKIYIKPIDYESVRTLAFSTMNLGVLYTYLGEFNKDLVFLEEALKLFKDFPDKSNEYVDQLASCLNNIGNHYARPENYDSGKLITYLEDALKLRRGIVDAENIPYSFRVSNILGNLAHAYCNKNDFPTAEIMLKEAVARHEAYEMIGIFSHRPSHITMLLNAAVFYTDYSRNKDAALNLTNRALQLLMISNPVDMIRKKSLGQIRSIYMEFGEKMPG